MQPLSVLNIPRDVTIHMFTFLDIKSLSKVQAVCKQWHCILNLDLFPLKKLRKYGTLLLKLQQVSQQKARDLDTIHEKLDIERRKLKKKLNPAERHGLDAVAWYVSQSPTLTKKIKRLAFKNLTNKISQLEESKANLDKKEAKKNQLAIEGMQQRGSQTHQVQKLSTEIKALCDLWDEPSTRIQLLKTVVPLVSSLGEGCKAR
jgi:hypothetical protein